MHWPDRPAAVGESATELTADRTALEVTTLSVSFDHRLMDGAQGSTFLAGVAAILTDTALALPLLTPSLAWKLVRISASNLVLRFMRVAPVRKRSQVAGALSMTQHPESTSS